MNYFINILLIYVDIVNNAPLTGEGRTIFMNSALLMRERRSNVIFYKFLVTNTILYRKTCIFYI